jgi:hypothetical protein
VCAYVCFFLSFLEFGVEGGHGELRLRLVVCANLGLALTDSATKGRVLALHQFPHTHARNSNLFVYFLDHKTTKQQPVLTFSPLCGQSYVACDPEQLRHPSGRFKPVPAPELPAGPA